jgi:nucleotide-binding universal stress UspA family protein
LPVEDSKFSKIMVAIDGSEHSLKAAEYALEIAKSFRSPLYAVTVTYVPESHHLKQEDVLNQSREMHDSMEGAKTCPANIPTGLLFLVTTTLDTCY